MWALDLVLIALLANTCPTTWLKFVLKNRYMNVAYVYLASNFDMADQLLGKARMACKDATCRSRVDFMATGSKHGEAAFPVAPCKIPPAHV